MGVKKTRAKKEQGDIQNEEGSVQINIRLNKEMAEKYYACKPEGFSRAHLGRAIMRLWTSLDHESQWKLLMAEGFYDRDPKQGEETFAAVILALAEKRKAKGSH